MQNTEEIAKLSFDNFSSFELQDKKADELNTMLFSLNFDNLKEQLEDYEISKFGDEEVDPSLPLIPIAINFMTALLNADKELAKR